MPKDVFSVHLAANIPISRLPTPDIPTFPRSRQAPSVLRIWSSGEIQDRMRRCFRPTAAKACSQCGLPSYDPDFNPYVPYLATLRIPCKTQRPLKYITIQKHHSAVISQKAQALQLDRPQNARSRQGHSQDYLGGEDALVNGHSKRRT